MATGKSNFTILTGDRRTKEVKQLSTWLKHVPTIRRQFERWSDDFDPLSFNEAASVAVLANAAAKAGYLAHTEYVAFKRHSTRGRPFRRGRCDLWIANVADGYSWAFEVKQHFAAHGMRQSTIRACLDRAVGDAKEVDQNEGKYRAGCLIICPMERTFCDSQYIERMDELISDMSIAFRVGEGRNAAWLAFQIV